jgi:threonylcarbamoyladenosine tRNA methylthiotransferase MtaB
VPSVVFKTLGCRLNQAETEALAAAFKKEGFSVETGKTDDSPDTGYCADIIVINTCTVTSKAEQKARRLIRGALRENPGARVIVSGCYANMEAGAIRALCEDIEGAAGRLFIVDGDTKNALPRLPKLLAETGDMAAAIAALGPGRPFEYAPAFYSFHSRAFLKIQDGCDNRCSYCRVTLARGRSVSLETKVILERLQALENAGCGEAVLTGVNIALYHDAALAVSDTAKPTVSDTAAGTTVSDTGLPALLPYLLAGTSRIALRLSSLEISASFSNGVSTRLLDALGDRRIRPHFHLSVQSGSPAILKKMRRPYAPADIEAAVARLRAVKDDPFIACDIITGFPGEGEAEYAETYAFCRRVGFAWIHAFPYSPRPGTEAYNFKNTVPQRLSGERVEQLLELARQGKKEYIKRWKGRTVEAVIERPLKQRLERMPCREKDGFLEALSENYLKLRIPAPEKIPARGSVVKCVIGDDAAASSDVGASFDAGAVLLEIMA